MKKLARIVARLYPRAWRDRYGPEFDALLEDVKPGVGDVVNVARGGVVMRFQDRLPMLAALVLVGALGGAAVSRLLPVTYRSTGTVRIQVASQSQSEFGSMVQRAASAALTRSTLTYVITQGDLYKQERQRMPMEDVIEKMKKSIRVGGARSDPHAFQISFDYADAGKAQQAASDVIMQILKTLPAPSQGVRTVHLPNQPASPLTPPYGTTTGVGATLGLGAGLLATLILRKRTQTT